MTVLWCIYCRKISKKTIMAKKRFSKWIFCSEFGKNLNRGMSKRDRNNNSSHLKQRGRFVSLINNNNSRWTSQRWHRSWRIVTTQLRYIKCHFCVVSFSRSMYCRYIRESKCTAKIRMIYGSATEDIISGSRGACLEAGLRGPRCHVTVFIRDLRGGITVLNQKGPLTAIAIRRQVRWPSAPCRRGVGDISFVLQNPCSLKLARIVASEVMFWE